MRRTHRHEDLPPKVATKARASPTDEAPVQHASWPLRLVGRAVPGTSDAGVFGRLARRVSGLRRRLTA